MDKENKIIIILILVICLLIGSLNNSTSYFFNNETKNIDFKESKKINEFYDILKKNGIDVTVRRKFGNKISAACGQLRSKEV